MRKKLLVAGPILLALAIIAFLSARKFRGHIIVSSGVIAANNMELLTSILLAIAILAFAAIVIICLIKPILSGATNKAKAEKLKVALSSGKDLRSDDIRELMDSHKQEYPHLANLLDSCLKQIGEIAMIQSKLAKIIHLNSADFLSDTLNATKESEQMILRNLVWVVNRGIATKTDDDGCTFRELIERVVSENTEVLADCFEMLRWASDWISQRKTDATPAISEVKLYTDIIRSKIRHSDSTTKIHF